MKKWVKGIMGLAAAGGTIAGLVYYLKKKDSSEDDEFDDEFEDNDFDLDSDLKPVSDREYVSLNSAAKSGKKPVTGQRLRRKLRRRLKQTQRPDRLRPAKKKKRLTRKVLLINPVPLALPLAGEGDFRLMPGTFHTTSSLYATLQAFPKQAIPYLWIVCIPSCLSTSAYLSFSI